MRRDLAYSGVAIVTSAAVSRYGRRVARWARGPSIQGDSSRRELVRALTRINETPLTLAAAATQGIGRLAGSATTADVGLQTFEALVLTTGVSEVIRGVLGRTRPHAHSHERTQLDRALLGVSAMPDGRGGVLVLVNARR